MTYAEMVRIVARSVPIRRDLAVFSIGRGIYIEKHLFVTKKNRKVIHKGVSRDLLDQDLSGRAAHQATP